MTEYFLTDSDIRVPGITTDQMREVDRIAISETGPNLYQMMENAGRSLAETALQSLDRATDGSSVVVLAGTGGNGGGGICAARHLANRGLDVRLVVTDRSRLAGVPKEQLDLYRSTSGNIVELRELDGVDVASVIDAVIGYSIDGAPRGRALELIEWANSSRAPILSLDVPSGIDATTGEAEGASVAATRTLTLALPKTGLSEASGDLLLADLGIPPSVFARIGIRLPAALFAQSFRVPIYPMH